MMSFTLTEGPIQTWWSCEGLGERQSSWWYSVLKSRPSHRLEESQSLGLFPNYDATNVGLCKCTLVTWWENQSRGWWCLSQRLRPHSLLWCSHGQCRGPDSSKCNHMASVLMFKSRTSTLKYLRSVKYCPIVLGILHCRVVLDLLKSVKKQKFPKLQCCDMSYLLHRANLSNLILPHEKCVNRDKLNT